MAAAGAIRVRRDDPPNGHRKVQEDRLARAICEGRLSPAARLKPRSGPPVHASKRPGSSIWAHAFVALAQQKRLQPVKGERTSPTVGGYPDGRRGTEQQRTRGRSSESRCMALGQPSPSDATARRRSRQPAPRPDPSGSEHRGSEARHRQPRLRIGDGAKQLTQATTVTSTSNAHPSTWVHSSVEGAFVPSAREPQAMSVVSGPVKCGEVAVPQRAINRGPEG